ncbi:sel1 repeat family protein [Primorskyibacter marinus]|uniref:sel1 repeat family protein n=1 Tax=Primorskyibacter marinus TaxID=1977320 RepID=UPI001E65D123|nr:sel1 repeat family protein [Primorskyibacter marinus]
MFRKTLCIAVFVTLPAFADTQTRTVEDEHGTLNPLDTGFGKVMSNIDKGQTDMMTCATGYYITKSGRHAPARKLFEACAAAGYTGAMTWMSQLENNGLGGDYNPDAAADWDRRAAMAGDPVGKFNYGLDLIRGHGVARDKAEGRRLVDEAAQEGLAIAKRLQIADYDLDEVTPDADNWRYAPAF